MMYYPIFDPRRDIDSCVRSETLRDFARVEADRADTSLKSAVEQFRASRNRWSKAVAKYDQLRREPQLASRAWSFVGAGGQESGAFSLVELMPLAKIVPTLRINNSLQELSLRLVDALNLQKGFLRAVGERTAAEAAEKEAEQRAREAETKLTAAEMRLEATEACLHYSRLAKRRWVFQSQIYSPEELKEAVAGSEYVLVYDIDTFAPSIPAGQAVAEWLEALENAKATTVASMDMAGVRALCPFNIDSECWQVSVEDNEQRAPYSLRDLRAWAETQDLSPYKLISHVDQPDVLLPFCHVCYYKELDSLVFGNDPQGKPVQLGGGEDALSCGHNNIQIAPPSPDTRVPEPSAGQEELKDVNIHIMKAPVQSTTEPTSVPCELQAPAKHGDNVESFDTIKKFITSLPTPKKRAGTMPFPAKRKAESAPCQGVSVKAESSKAGSKTVGNKVGLDPPADLNAGEVKRTRVKEDSGTGSADSNPS